MQPYKHSDLVDYAINPDSELPQKRRMNALLDGIEYIPLTIYQGNTPPEDQVNTIWAKIGVMEGGDNIKFAFHNGKHWEWVEKWNKE